MDIPELLPSREAIHEAGHLLCIWQVGFTATDVTLQGAEGTSGSVGWQDPRGRFDLEHLQKSMQVDVAGTAAEIVLLGSYLQGPWEYQVPDTDANHFLKKCLFGLELDRYEDSITQEQESFFQRRWLEELQKMRQVFSAADHRSQLLFLAREVDFFQVLDRGQLLELQHHLALL